MREKSIVPTTLADWPRVAGLLPELKLILGLGFWAGRYTNSIGVASLPLRPLAASLGLDPSALQQGINALCHEQLLIADWDTLEVFVYDWFRFHTFKATGREIARKEFGKIASRKISIAVLKAAPWLRHSDEVQAEIREPLSIQKVGSPTAAATTTSTAVAKIRFRRDSGIVTFLPTDFDRASALEKKFSQEHIDAAIRVIEARNQEPVPGLIEKQIEVHLKAVKRAVAVCPRNEVANASQAEDSSKWLAQAWSALGKPPKPRQS